MLLLIGTADKLQLTTGSAATVDVVASYMDATNASPPVVQGDTSNTQVTAITTATTTDIVAAPAAGEIRRIKALHIRNKHATTATDVTVILDRSGTDYELHKVTLSPGEALEYIEGVGFYELAASFVTGTYTNRSTSAQGAGFATDTYLTGSSVPLAGLGTPFVGLAYILRFDITKTAAGTAAPVIAIRVGTAGTTSDTARCTFTFAAGTAAADAVEVLILCMFRAVGSGTSAVLQGRASATTNLATTGWSNAVKVVLATSGGFDSTVANSIIGASYNGGTSASHTVQQVNAELKAY